MSCVVKLINNVMTQNSRHLGLFYSQAASRNNAFSDAMTHTATK